MNCLGVFGMQSKSTITTVAKMLQIYVYTKNVTCHALVKFLVYLPINCKLYFRKPSQCQFERKYGSALQCSKCSFFFGFFLCFLFFLVGHGLCDLKAGA